MLLLIYYINYDYIISYCVVSYFIVFYPHEIDGRLLLAVCLRAQQGSNNFTELAEGAAITMITQINQCCVMLCCVVLCCACYVMSCPVMLCYVMLCYVMLCHVVLCCIVLHCVVLCYNRLCCVMSSYVMSCHVTVGLGRVG